MEFFLLGFNVWDLGFFLVGTIVWGFIIAGALFFLWGLFRQSWKAVFISGLALLVPAFILYTQPGYTKLFILLPILIFGLAFFMKRKG
ncbi:hypothetical protein [Neobacillus sp. LXY-4]|uniref:hypothetical protein n=1 Tax=Neobacillus sp. LXY-4 TaxID=3379826 RepID=UPI003EE261B7